ncbi:PFL_4669 family integrating conjugative element protein [Pseudomonas caricapapayae]|uniref:PFL_4669 family integrating conjugative element protein n=1 Tax=Pseudomonas caricapapayae TaxID=46678 RepID=UPI000F006C52|nr:TIGR03761 family integrating conjugative element protein [Pseudomonas caricapapayae]
MSDQFQLNLGSLRSAMTLELHTHHAARIWHGRKAEGGRSAILGLTGFVNLMNRMKRGAEQDDPYSDMWIIRMEECLAEAKQQMKEIHDQLDGIMAALPKALSIGDNLNISPVQVPLYVNAQLGFKAVYLLTDYDELTRRLLLAHHTALIGRREMEQWINEGSKIIRSAFGLAQQYKFSGATRDDIKSKNARGRDAVEKFGELPQDVLEGTRRSEFAPPILRGTAETPSVDSDSSADVDDED